jgi:hypothetical protein
MAMAMPTFIETVRVEIRREFRGGLVCCRERHVSVGPHQIERVSTHSGASFQAAREFMKRQTTIAADAMPRDVRKRPTARRASDVSGVKL